MNEYRIDDLAREAGTSVRNVRAYQDRGLLPPPRRSGRVALYSDAHLVRLRLIAELLRRGYALANIGELLSAWERGRELRDVIGLEMAVAGPWSDEAPVHMTGEELARLFGGGEAAAGIERAVEVGFLEPEGNGYRVLSPRQVHAAAEMVAAGVPLDAVLDLGAELHRRIDAVAAAFVETVSTHVFDPLAELSPEQVPRLAELVHRLRPLARMAVDAELARAMERHARARLGERLAALFDDNTGEEQSA
ncbi:MAG TPA: MerR family transcriptional regulator [Acidimicrobiales bacterium]|nr:MerR family transcriptional regulator [Acidimicrobiales bacterium]